MYLKDNYLNVNCKDCKAFYMIFETLSPYVIYKNCNNCIKYENCIRCCNYKILYTIFKALSFCYNIKYKEYKEYNNCD